MSEWVSERKSRTAKVECRPPSRARLKVRNMSELKEARARDVGVADNQGEMWTECGRH